MCAVAVDELPAEGFKVVTGREVNPGKGTFTAVWNRLEAIQSRDTLVRSLTADTKPSEPWAQPASFQVRLWRR